MADMPENFFGDSHKSKAIWQKLSETSLLFRGVANAALPEADRPCPKPLLRRIHWSKEFLELFRRLLLEVASKFSFPNAPSQSESRRFKNLQDLEAAIVKAEPANESDVLEGLALEICRRLPDEPEFKTLLLEAIREASSWFDLFSPGYKFKERGQSILEKLFSSKHPASRTATSVFLGALGILFASKAVLTIVPDLLDKNLSIPVHATLEAPEKELKLKFTSGEAKETIELKLVPDKDNPPFPLRLESKDPIGVSFTSQHPVDVTFRPKSPVTVPFDFSKASLAKSGFPCPCPSKLTLDTSNLEPAATQLHKDVQAVGESLKRAHDDELNLITRVKSLEGQVIQVDTQSKLADQDFSNILATTSLTLSEKHDGIALLQWLDEKGSSEQCKVQVNAALVNSAYDVRLSPKECSSMKPNTAKNSIWSKDTVQFQINEPQDLAPIPFHVQITDAVHHWYGGSHVTFRFQPNPRHRLELLRAEPPKTSTTTSMALPTQFNPKLVETQTEGQEKER